ncbi:ulp1 protease family, C-terminal catalytic domain-containing protein [Tanacetum coccineum]
MASDGSDPDAEYALSKILQMGTVAEYQNESNPKTLEEAFSVALVAEARFTNQQLWELLRSYPLTSGEAFFRARITEARFEDENNQAVDTNVGDQEDLLAFMHLEGIHSDNSTSSHVLNANENNESYINDRHGNLNEMLHDLDANDGEINQEDLPTIVLRKQRRQCLKQPGNDLDVYLSPLINDMKTLWKPGVEMYDAYMKEKFHLHAMIFCTINDVLAYGNLSGYNTKGKQACPICEDETSSRWLDNCKKTVFMGHRRSLPSNHPYRGMSSEFDVHTEYGRVRTRFSGDIALSRVSNLNTVFGKGKGRQIEQGTWKKKSIFGSWNTGRIWKYDIVLTLWHMNKEVCDSLLGLLLNIPRKTKDGINARKDMVSWGIRLELSPVENDKKCTYLPPAYYTMSKAEKTQFRKSNAIRTPNAIRGLYELLESQGALLPPIPTSWPQMVEQPMSSHSLTTEPAEPKQTQEDRIKERLDRVKYRPRSIQGFVKRFTNCKNISIVAPLEMYDGPWREWIEYEAILDLHIEGKIDITFIHWWTMHLYSKAKRLPDNKCTFLNPHLITSSQCRSKENEVIEHIMDTKRLNPGKDIYMAPYMQGDSHWVLMVLCPNSRKGYIVDSYEYEKKNENSALDTKFDWTMVKVFIQSEDGNAATI